MASGADRPEGPGYPALAKSPQEDPRDVIERVLMPRDAEVTNPELQVLDALEEVTRTEDPEAVERWVDGLHVGEARTVWHRLREASREHGRRAERLERLAGLLSQQVHAAADGSSADSTRPVPADPFR